MNRLFVVTPLGLALGLVLASVARADQPAGDLGPEPRPAVAVLVDLTLKGTISEDPAPIGLDGEAVSENLRGLIDRIARARKDDQVQGLVIRLRDVKLGWAKAHELRQAIREFRGSGKKVVALLEMAGNHDYLIATAADEVVMPESGWLMLKGLAAEVTFYRELFDKLGIQPDMMQVGEFKGAGEPFTRTRMSDPFRAELKAILTDSYELLAEAIADRRGVSVEKARDLIDDGPYTPAAAREAGLIDRVAYADELESEIAKGLGVESVKLDAKYGKKKEKAELSGLAGLMKLMQTLAGESPQKAGSERPKVAIIYASGLIQAGKSAGGSVLGDAVLGSDTLIKNLHEAEKDPTVKAIVLRVDSPGGSALASDLIWREVVRIEKPIVASLSDVAASGGYYISMGADRIVAEPGTLTGSIGVVGGKVALGGLMDRIGLTTDTVSVGKHGTLMSVVRPFNPEDKGVMRRLMEETYQQFVAKAAEGRKMDRARMESLAAGRIYTGRQAKEAGLVDDLGTLNEAVAAAKELGGLARDADAELLIMPRPQGVLESLLSPLEDRSATAPGLASQLLLLPEPARSTLARLGRMTRMLTSEPVLVVMPFELFIR